MKKTVIPIIVTVIFILTFLTTFPIYAEPKGYKGPIPMVIANVCFHPPESLGFPEDFIAFYKIKAFDGSSVGAEDWGKWNTYNNYGYTAKIEITNVEVLSESAMLIEAEVIDSNVPEWIGLHISEIFHDGGPGGKEDYIHSNNNGFDYSLEKGNILVKTFGLLE